MASETSSRSPMPHQSSVPAHARRDSAVEQAKAEMARPALIARAGLTPRLIASELPLAADRADAKRKAFDLEAMVCWAC